MLNEYILNGFFFKLMRVKWPGIASYLYTAMNSYYIYVFNIQKS